MENDIFYFRLHISKMHTKEEMEKICQYCNQKTNSLEYHIRNAFQKQNLKKNNPLILRYKNKNLPKVQNIQYSRYFRIINKTNN